jgi:pteridine reductase
MAGSSDSPGKARVALVTGAAQRIGAAALRRLHDAGYDVILHYNRSGAIATALAAELGALRPGSVHLLQADLLDSTQIAPLAAAALAWRGRLDLVVNNASQFYPTPFGAISLDDWQRLMGSNALAPLLLCQACAPALRASGGAIVNLADSTAALGVKDFLPYAMAKAALVNLTRSLARELAPAVRVNAIAPGAILWPEYTGGVSEQEKADRLRHTALGRLGSVDDIADAILFLATATYVTGQTLHVDGGARLYN